MPGDRRHARRYSACSSLGEEPCGSRIAWLCPATPSGPAAERPDAAATDCVLNRLFRPMRDAVPLLERSCRTSRVASVRAPDESRPRPAGNAGRDEGAPTYGALYPGARFVGEQRAADEGLHAGGAPKAYPVTVTLQDVALGQAALCGYLTIRNLTAEHPSLTTFFEAKVVGPRAGFLTRRWDATPDTDLRHWLRFPYFRAHCRPYFDAELSGSSSGLVRDSISEAERHAEYAAGRGNESGSLNTGGGLGDALLRRLAAASVESLGAPPSPGTDAWRVYHAGASHSTVFASPAPWSVVGTRADGGRVSPAPSPAGGTRMHSDGAESGSAYAYADHGVVFMRWKEHFLVPDHHVGAISGASYAGFYYAAYDAARHTIEGYYYHRQSQEFQRLELRHVPATAFPSFEFR